MKSTVAGVPGGVTLAYAIATTIWQRRWASDQLPGGRCAIRMGPIRIGLDENGGRMTDTEMGILFQTRVDAIRKKDRELLLSTQVTEIPFAASEGYMSLSDIDIDVLYTYDVSDLERVVFVRENYKRSTGSDRAAFLLYYFTNTVKGWRVFRVQ